MQEASTAIFNSAQDGGRFDGLSVVCGRPHTFSHFFVTHLAVAGSDIRTVREPFGTKTSTRPSYKPKMVDRDESRMRLI
jgi:hypothetical protein